MTLASPTAGRAALSGALVVAGWAAGLLAGCSSAPPATRTTLELRHEQDADDAFRMGRYGVAARRYERAVSLARAQDDQVVVGRLLLRQGIALSALGQCALALPRLHESAAIRQRLGDAGGLRLAQLALGRCLAETGNAAAAKAALQGAASGKGGCTRVEALAGLGALRAQAADPAGARANYTAAARNVCNKPGPNALLAYNRGRLAVREGNSSGALQWLKTAIKSYARAQDEAGLSDALFALGQLRAQSNRAGEAGDALRRAGHAAWSAGRPRRAAQAFALAAAQFRKAGRTAEAQRCLVLGRQALPVP